MMGRAYRLELQFAKQDILAMFAVTIWLRKGMETSNSHILLIPRWSWGLVLGEVSFYSPLFMGLAFGVQLVFVLLLNNRNVPKLVLKIIDKINFNKARLWV